MTSDEIVDGLTTRALDLEFTYVGCRKQMFEEAAALITSQQKQIEALMGRIKTIEKSCTMGSDGRLEIEDEESFLHGLYGEFAMFKTKEADKDKQIEVMREVKEQIIKDYREAVMSKIQSLSKGEYA